VLVLNSRVTDTVGALHCAANGCFSIITAEAECRFLVEFLMWAKLLQAFL
jgi:hypothetical protein